MHRCLYPVLLLTTIAVAAAFLMRPSLGQELISLVRSRQNGGAPFQGYSDGPTVPASGPAEIPSPSTRVGSSVQAPSWLATADQATQPSHRPYDPPAERTAYPPGRYPRARGAPAERHLPEDAAEYSADWRGPDPTPPRHYPTAGVRTGSPRAEQAEAKPCEGARILARVGDDVILASEVNPTVDTLFEARKDRVPLGQHELLRKLLTMKTLQDRIALCLANQDAKRSIPAENFQGLKKKLADHFEKEVVPKRIEAAGVGSRRELEDALRSYGTSLEQQKRLFVQQAVSDIWKREQKVADPVVSHEDMLDYYRQHVAEFEHPARALWEKLSVRIPRYSDGSEAYATLARMGNQLMRGVPIAEVLQTQPQGELRCRGGDQGWLTEDDMGVSSVLEEAIFGLPVGRLSTILKDEEGFHIVRVLKREPATRTPFEEPEAQKLIREELLEVRRQEQLQDELARLRKEIPVWTVFDGDPELAQYQSAPTRR